MIDNSSVLAIIPARSGSKRLPEKNIRKLCGKPMMAWSVEAAIQSEYVDRVIVSTEDEKIAAIAKEYGAEVPFMRPEYLATDEATTISVVRDVLLKCKKLGNNFDYVIVLQPTSPLRTSKHIDEAIRMIAERGASSVIGVVKVTHPVEWSSRLGSDGSMAEFIHIGVGNTRCQDYKERHRICGAIYVCNTEMILSNKPAFIDDGSIAYIMDEVSSLDIDNELDFLLAEYILTRKHPASSCLP